MKEFKQVFLTIVMIAIAAALFAENKAIITEKQGKVEIFESGKWLPAKVGMELNLGATISTGFNSSAKIDLGDSTLEVSQLSRMKIEQLVKRNKIANTTLFLKVGKVKANVKSSAKLKHNFRFKSPVATASVRGTSFTFTPFRLIVHEGSVDFSNNYGQRALVIVGQKANADAENGVTNKTISEYLIPDLAGEDQVKIEPESNESPTTGSVNVTVEYQ